MHTKKLENLLYLPVSPVNILSAIALDKSTKDNKVTWVLTKINILFSLEILIIK